MYVFRRVWHSGGPSFYENRPETEPELSMLVNEDRSSTILGLDRTKKVDYSFCTCVIVYTHKRLSLYDVKSRSIEKRRDLKMTPSCTFLYKVKRLQI